MSALVVVVLAGALGAPARLLVDRWVSSRLTGQFPWGTYLVNVTGSFLLGFVTGLGLYQGLGHLPETALGAGFCGAYTTFSTFSYETVRLAGEGSPGAAVLNAGGSLAAGLAAGALGLGLAAAL